ncbi:serine/threonine-protein kinase [Lacipirellula limnantheis]|uniref:Serine/threonine-protein kinase PrkC n=1 Tax=Lacipirellula limnantheis TaxID=2528024 RepID=A0A517TWF1_9BACT|nr:serine/threonine-protein kinase [Lacipirellula limnantheis]QDT72701.1 Serine/threonine-protein kinase PrkC [Lacipirellula limnantheis]
MTANEFLDLLRRSQLVEEDQLTKFLGGMAARNKHRVPDDAELIAAAMIEAGILTEWQSEKLLAGKHKGFMLGKYKLLRHLGKGGMSQVYLAEHMLMKRKVAIKVLPSNRVEDSTYLERFRTEARAAAKLDDPNIVRVYDIDNDGKTHYIVMEYVDGRDLHVLVKEDGPLGYERAADYIAQVARGIAHAHDMGLVHRDIKPANCMVTKHEVVKLLDMGLARLIDDEASLTLENNENVLGTADYLAPEQALNSHKADARADIYSLGCTLYFLLMGHPPFPEGTISERLLKHQVEQAPSIFKERPDAPSVLVNICNRMMAKRADERYQTAGEVAERLTEWLADRGIAIGDSGKRKDPSGSGGGGGGGGLGSDVFRRFAASMSKVGHDSGNRASSPGAGSGGTRKPTAVAAAKVRTEPEEEMKLAPLEDEPPKKAVIAEIAKATAPAASPAAANGAATPAPPPATPEKPKKVKSLFEEEFDAARASAPKVRPARKEGEFDPLRPPGFAGPSYGPPGWVYAAIGFGVFVVLCVVGALVFGVF